MLTLFAALVAGLAVAAASVQDLEPQTERSGRHRYDLLDDRTTPVDLKIDATHRIAFPGSDQIHGVDFSPDGSRLYTIIEITAIDVWGILVSWWPEILGGVVALLLVVFLLALARVRRRPQTPGAPHCRKCNYNVVSQLAQAQVPKLCPECGVDIERKRPRRGRSAMRRLCVPALIAIIGMLLYAGMHIAGLPRAGRASGWLLLTSTRLDRYATDKNIAWLLKHQKTMFRVVVIETATGRQIGALGRVRGYPMGLRVSPDGRHLAIVESPSRVSWVSASTGWTAASQAVDGVFQSGYRQTFIVGFSGSASDPWVYYSFVSPTAEKSRLCRWRPRTGENQTVVEEQAFSREVPARPGTRMYSTRRYALLNRSGVPEGDDLPAIASAADFTEAYELKKYPIVVRGSDGSEERTIVINEQFACTSPLVVTPDGARAFVSAASRGIIGVDLNTGERIGELTAGMFDNFNDNLATDARGRRLYIDCGRGSMLVRDTETRRWRARLRLPEEFMAPQPRVSPDGRWLAAIPFRSSTGRATPGTRYIHELFLFDLSPIDKSAPSTPPSDTTTVP